MNSLKPLSVEEFTSIAKNQNELDITNFKEYFKVQIEEAPSFAIGPYCWFIADNANFTIANASENIGDLTPLAQKDWEGQPAMIFAENIHEEDRFYVLSAFQLAVEKIEQLPPERRKHVKVNIYNRMLNAQRNYRWVLMQIPGLYINDVTRATCGLIMITDLSHFNFNGRPIMMTLVDNVNNKNEYFHIASNEMKLEKAQLPNITKREQEILRLMAKGMNTPKIAAELFLSYHTVEKHKRNLRQKTNTQTSAELMNYVCVNNLY